MSGQQKATKNVNKFNNVKEVYVISTQASGLITSVYEIQMTEVHVK